MLYEKLCKSDACVHHVKHSAHIFEDLKDYQQNLPFLWKNKLSDIDISLNRKIVADIKRESHNCRTAVVQVSHSCHMIRVQIKFFLYMFYLEDCEDLDTKLTEMVNLVPRRSLPRE